LNIHGLEAVDTLLIGFSWVLESREGSEDGTLCNGEKAELRLASDRDIHIPKQPW
jgi:hypothetical protein